MNAGPAIEAELRQLEERLLQPELRASAERVAALLADDFMEFGSSGKVFDKKQIIEVLGRESAARRSLSAFRSTMLSDNIALVTYRATRSAKPDAPAVHTLRSSIWRSCNGQWQMVFHQGTPTR